MRAVRRPRPRVARGSPVPWWAYPAAMPTTAAVTVPAAHRPQVRRAALAALVANIGIVLTGGIVRVTASGLGCSDWPTCSGTSVVPSGSDLGWHSAVEFGNRLLTFAVLAAAVWVVVAVRREAPDRPDLRVLAWAQPAGVVGQAALGGVTVLTGLHPLVVAAHFLASMGLVAAAVVLFDRARGLAADRVPGLPAATGAIVAAAGVVLVLGTLVTGSGPHAGDVGTVRLGLDVRTVAVAHADAVWVLVGLTVAVLAVAVGTGAIRARRAATMLLAVEIAQGGLGYLQYALGVPPVPVIVHILGAAVVWSAAWHLAVAVRPSRHEPDPVEGRATTRDADALAGRT